jgi:hypothetical protein
MSSTCSFIAMSGLIVSKETMLMAALYVICIWVPVPVAARLLRLWVRIPSEGHGCLSVVSVVCCQVEVSAKSRSVSQRSPTDCGVSGCDLENSRMRRPWPSWGCCAQNKQTNKRTNVLGYRCTMTGHGPHYSPLVNCLVPCIVCVGCVVLCIVSVDCVVLCIVCV